MNPCLYIRGCRPSKELQPVPAWQNRAPPGRLQRPRPCFHCRCGGISCGAFAGYLVVESRPLVNRAARAGARTPGFALVTCIEPADGLPYAEFLRIWHEQQRACAIETQSTFGYVRNEIVRALTPSAPTWAAIIEENFPLAALTGPAAFYEAVGDPAKLKRNLKRMLDTCQGFLAQERDESHPMSEYVL